MSVVQIPPHQAPSEQDEAFWQAWDEFFAAIRRVRGRAASGLDGGLTISQFHLLSAAEERPEAGLRELAEQVGSSAPTVTRMLTTLERGGLLSRTPSTRGQGRVCVRLTARGQELLVEKRAEMSAKRDAVYASLTAEERAQAQRLFPRLAEALDAL
jgi:DNA-binding MarR family transcriptional regulator